MSATILPWIMNSIFIPLSQSSFAQSTSFITKSMFADFQDDSNSFIEDSNTVSPFQISNPPFVDGYVNVTSEHYLPVWVNSLSMANSIFYLICFAVYYLALAIFLFKIRNIQMKRNPKIMFILAISFVAIQSANLIIRVVYDAMHIYAKVASESGQLMTVPFFVTLNLMGALTIFFMFSDFAYLFVILFFFQKIFWTTAQLMGAISKKTLRHIQLMLNISTFVFVILCELMIILVSAFFFLQKSNMVGKPPTMGVYIGCFLVLLIMLLFDGIVTIVSGVLVIRTIKKTSRAVMATSQKYHKNTVSTVSTSQMTPRGSIESEKSSNLPNAPIERSSIDKKIEERIQSPFKVTFGLLMALVACILFQLVAAGIASGATEIDIIKPVWYFFNCLGVLAFAVIILFLYYPMFVNTDVAFKEIEISKSNAQKGNGFNNGSVSQRSTLQQGTQSMGEKEMTLHVAIMNNDSTPISPSTITATTTTVATPGTTPTIIESNKLLQTTMNVQQKNGTSSHDESPSSHHNHSSSSSSSSSSMEGEQV